MSVSDAAQPGSVRKAQFAMIPMWAHRRIIATRTRTMALAVYVELVGQYAGSSRDAEGLKVWPEMQQIADSMGVPKRNIQRALDVLVDCGVVLKKRTVRRNQYWLPQEEPDASTETLAEFQSATSGTLDSVQSATSGTSGSAATGTLRSAATGTLYNPDPSIQTQETHLSLAPVVPKAEDAPARAAAIEEREMDAAPNTTTTTTPAAAAAALPGVDAYTAQLADAAATARVPAPRATGTDSQQQEQHGPQAASRPPAVTSASPAAQRIVDAYTTVLGRPVLSGTRGKLHDQAAEALAAGYPETWLTDRARELAAHGWTDLAKHIEKSTAPLPGATPAAASSGRPPWCGECGGGHGAAAQFNMRFRRRDDGTLCHCHPDVALPRPSTTDARVQAALDLGRQMQAEHDARNRTHRQPYQPYREPTPEERAADLGCF